MACSPLALEAMPTSGGKARRPAQFALPPAQRMDSLAECPSLSPCGSSVSKSARRDIGSAKTRSARKTRPKGRATWPEMNSMSPARIAFDRRPRRTSAISGTDNASGGCLPPVVSAPIPGNLQTLPAARREALGDCPCDDLGIIACESFEGLQRANDLARACELHLGDWDGLHRHLSPQPWKYRQS